MIKNKTAYDIVFMDHMMPKMDGMEATKIIRDSGYARPIIALTANAVVGQAEIFLANGFDDFIAKPIDSRKLDMILKSYVRDKHPPETVEAARRQMEKQKPVNRPTYRIQINSHFIKVIVMDIEKALAVLEEILPKIGDGDDADIKLFIITVHGMKSALLNIGETELSATALKLEQAGGAGEITKISSDTPSFMNALRALVERYKQMAVENNDSITDEDRGVLTEKLSEIKTACKRIQKKVAKTALDGLKEKTWPYAINKLLDEISMCILHGEFKKAVSAIEAAAAMQPVGSGDKADD